MRILHRDLEVVFTLAGPEEIRLNGATSLRALGLQAAIYRLNWCSPWTIFLYTNNHLRDFASRCKGSVCILVLRPTDLSDEQFSSDYYLPRGFAGKMCVAGNY